MSKMHPQKRAQSALVSMVESNHREDAKAQAQDWLDRGWNPFKPQEDSRYHSKTGIELMFEQWSWREWLAARVDVLAPLAAQAFGKTASGKLDMGDLLCFAAQKCWCEDSKSEDAKDMLGLLLACGADPDAFGEGASKWSSRAYAPTNSAVDDAQGPPLFFATSAGARRLVQAGADPKVRGEAREDAKVGPSLWEAWAERAARGDASAEDLDWIETLHPPEIRPGAGLGARCVRNIASMDGAREVLRRMMAAGASPEELGLSSESLGAALRKLANEGGAKAPEALALVAGVVGWPAVFEAMGPRESASWAAADLRGWRGGVDKLTPLAAALWVGNTRLLGALEREGFLGEAKGKGLAKLCAGMWEAAARANGGELDPKLSPRQMIPSADGLAWAIGRLGKDGGPEAREALAAAAKSCPALAHKAASACAVKVWTTQKGKDGLEELFAGGKKWSQASAGKSFQEFVALCDQRDLKRLMAKPKGKKAKAELAAAKPNPRRL